MFGIAQIPLVQAYPLSLWSPHLSLAEEESKPSDDPTLWIYLLVAVGLVLLGGAFAGLTIALMGQVRLRGCSMARDIAKESHRMRSIYKSSKHPGNRTSRNMRVGFLCC